MKQSLIGVQIFYKFWWDTELDDLKELSIDAHNVWKQAGKPTSGPVYEAKRLSHTNYKLTIKHKRQGSQEMFTNDLHEALMAKDNVSFWKNWRAKFGHQKRARVVEGLTNCEDIAETFAGIFESASKPNTPSLNVLAKAVFEKKLSNYEDNMQCHIILLTVDEVGACIRKLKRGKASGFDNITADHVIKSHGIVVVQLTCLFNCMIRQGYVPDAFGTGIIIPLVKDTTGNRGSADNYRGITLSQVRQTSKVPQSDSLRQQGDDDGACLYGSELYSVQYMATTGLSAHLATDGDTKTVRTPLA